MEALRAQLAETQGALTDRDKKFRQLKADQKSWSAEKSALEARIARLESENRRLKGTPSNTTDESSKPVASTHHEANGPEVALTQKRIVNPLALQDQQAADGDETVTITRSRMKQAEAQFNQMIDEVAEKAKLCESLQASLTQSSPIPVLELSNDEVVKRWNKLQEQIRLLSLERLSKTFASNLVSDKYKDEFKLLSPHWKTYASNENLTSYMFRALIWRYVLRYFEVFCRAFGRDISRKIDEVAAALSTKIPDAEFQEWRIRTAAVVEMACPIDKGLIDEITTKLLGAITPLVEDANFVTLKTSLRDIVTTVADLSAKFDRSNFVVLMHNEPGSSLTHGFPFADKLMEIKARFGSQSVVDLMITPCLLKKEAEYSVLVKAEVIC